MRHLTGATLPTSLFAVLLLTPSQLDPSKLASRTISLGEHLTPIAQVPEENRELARRLTGTDTAVGFYYSSVRVLWVDFIAWDGSFCLYSDDEVWLLEPAHAAALLSIRESELRRPWRYRFPPGLLAMIAVFFIGLIYIATQRKRNAKVEALFDDPLYKHALRIVIDRADRSSDRGMEQGIDEAARYLFDQGIPAGRARSNLDRMVSLIDNSEPDAEPPAET